MATIEETEEEQIPKKGKKEKPKNRLDCNIACVHKRSRLNPFIKRTRVIAINVFELKLPEYESKSTTKNIVCPKCMGNLEVTVKPEKSGYRNYKLIVLLYVLIFIALNVWLQQQQELASNLNTVLQINAILLGISLGLLLLVGLNTYLKTRSVRAIRLKIKGQSNMAHKLYKAKRTDIREKKLKIPR